jgi:hypothetical protein
MSFDALIRKVQQAEAALEGQERRTGADWRQLKASWRALWTPGRIVLAGLVSGFIVGRAEPLKHAAGGGVLQLVSALSGLFAGGSAQAAASEAGDAAEAAKRSGAAPAPVSAANDAAGVDAARVDDDAAMAAGDFDAERRFREAGLP